MVFIRFLSLLINLSYSFVLAGPVSGNHSTDAFADLKPRQDTTTFISTCGYLEGNANQPRTANSGFYCSSDPLNGLWGFCPTTVISATECELAGNCIDLHGCTSGCGLFGNPGIVTATCTNPGEDYCSSAVLTDALSSSYTYVACGFQAQVDHLLETPTNPLASTTTSTSYSSIFAAPSSLPPALPTASSSKTLSSFTSSSNLSSSNSATTPSSFLSKNADALVGGILGGLALICFVVLAIIFLQRYKAISGKARLDQGPISQSDNIYGDRYNSDVPKNRYGDSKAELASKPLPFPNGSIELPGYPYRENLYQK